jgi:tetratricopeptide (TPR) repeat protein
MTFNKYYVGCTRSTKSFVIIEENEKIFDSNSPIYKTLLSSFAPIYKAEQVDTYILEDNTFDAWYKEALQNLDNDNPATFEHALMHARRLAKTEEDIRLIKELIEGNPETLERYGFNYLAEGEYDLARSAFIKCNKTTKKHGPYILLATILGGRNISDDHLREFLRHSEIINKYPEVLPKLMKKTAFKARLKRIQIRLFGKEGE